MKRSSLPKGFRLESPGWADSVRSWLERLLHRQETPGPAVVFDFDNTLVRGDVGEATLAVLAKSGVLAKSRLPTGACPEFRSRNGRLISLRSCADALEYYLEVLDLTAHDSLDPAPLGNGYVWAVEIMEGLTPAQIIEATAEAAALGRQNPGAIIEVTAGKTAFPAPSFYPEMVELIARLLAGGFSIWIVSASNVWSVRWMVRNALQPLLRAIGCARSIPLRQVVGVSTLLRDPNGYFHKDPSLCRERCSYLELKPSALRTFALTNRLLFPVPVYSGKISCIADYVGAIPFLCVGDSPSDLPMLGFGRNRLWIARLDKPDYQRRAIKALTLFPPATWEVQPAHTGQFQPMSLRRGATARRNYPPGVRKGLSLWRDCSR